MINRKNGVLQKLLPLNEDQLEYEKKNSNEK